MTDTDVSGRALAELDTAASVNPIERDHPIGWHFWVPFAAAVSMLLVVAGLLLTLTAELRAGWIPGHELPMDKAAAIHKLLFRP